MNLMIVDDSARVREMIKTTLIGGLKNIGNICECASGNEAIERYKEIQPDWVLMDIQMEPVDGLVATRIILSSYPEAKIVIVSGFGDAKYREAAQAAGVYAYVLKENLRELPGIMTKGD